MRMIGLFCGVIAAAALTGCNTMRITGGPPPLTAFTCSYDVDCVVTVFVTNTNPCVVSVDRPDIWMQGSFTWTGVKHLIRWELDLAALTVDFRFDPNKGVVLKTPDTAGQFSGQSPQGGGKQYHWRDKNSNTFDYPYEINIIHKTSTNHCTLDPKIVNF